MPDRWIIRVQGKDYGPVDFETLREWKSEGRVIPQNPARPATVDAWITAAEIPGLFDSAKTPISSGPPPVQTTIRDEMRATAEAEVRPRGFFQILGETFRVYWKAFFKFLGLAILVTVPSACAQLASVWIESTPSLNVDLRSAVAAGFAFCMRVLFLVLWPIYVAGLQILSAETLAGRRIGFFTTLNEAVKFWPRVAALCIFVFIVFFLLGLFALGIAFMIPAGASSPIIIFFALALLALQVWMFGRFFINVLFWEQFAVLENAGVAESLRESKRLARGGREFRWYQRPLWRGALIASIWFAFALAIDTAVAWPAVQEWFRTMMDPQKLQALADAMKTGQTPAWLDTMKTTQTATGLDLSDAGLELLKRLLRPLLGIAFVVLYFAHKRGGEA